LESDILQAAAIIVFRSSMSSADTGMMKCRVAATSCYVMERINQRQSIGLYEWTGSRW